jgi:hypothetical protein
MGCKRWDAAKGVCVAKNVPQGCHPTDCNGRHYERYGSCYPLMIRWGERYRRFMSRSVDFLDKAERFKRFFRGFGNSRCKGILFALDRIEIEQFGTLSRGGGAR